MEIPVETIRRHLERFQPLVVYLFGSAATGSARAESDVDIGFLPPRPCDSYEVFRASGDLATDIGREVDLVDLSNASTVMRVEVLRTGRRLYTADETRADEFEMYALADYADLGEERKDAVRRFVGKVRGEQDA